MTDLVSRVAAAIGQARTQVDEDDVRNSNTRQGDEGRFGFASPITVALERMTAQRRVLLAGLEKITAEHGPHAVAPNLCNSCQYHECPCPTLLLIAEALGCSTEEDS